MDYDKALKVVLESCEFIFGVDTELIALDRTLKENGMGEADLLPVLLKIESELDMEIDDTDFRQIHDEGNPSLFRNRPTIELVEFIESL